VLPSGYCAAHDDGEVGERFRKARAAAATDQGPRAKLTRAEVYEAVLERNTPALLRARIDALRATRVQVIPGSGELVATRLPDHAQRIKAAESLENRVLGTPRQAIDLSGQLYATLAAGGAPTEGDPDADRNHERNHAPLGLPEST